MTISRRRFIGLAAAAAGGTAAVTIAGLAATRTLGTGQPGVLLASARSHPAMFSKPLPIPPVLAPTRTDGSADYYDITQKPAMLSIFDDVRTPAWTYGGTFPGPTLISPTGRRTVVTHRNELAHPVVVHLHGGHTPHDSDGYPSDLILPVGSAPEASMQAMPGMPAMPVNPLVGTRTYTYPLQQRAATLWYHDHRMGFTGPAVWYGLAGFHLVTDATENTLGLPDGDHDIPLMICDRAFDAEGRLTYPSLDPSLVTPGVQAAWHDGVLGDVILVNGAPWPIMDVDRGAYRFRIVNASNARRYRLTLDPPAPLVQIGSDGGLLRGPITHDAIEMAPAERFEVVIDFSRFPAGTHVTLRNNLGAGPTSQIMQFLVGASKATPARIPAKLADLPAADPSSATTTRDFWFYDMPGNGGWRINGQTYDPRHPMATPTLGRAEIWRLTADGNHHPIHLHLNHFRVLERNGQPPGVYDSGFKDTVDIGPSETVTILVTFTDYSGRYVFHCHNLEHEDMAMMGDFLTT